MPWWMQSPNHRITHDVTGCHTCPSVSHRSGLSTSTLGMSMSTPRVMEPWHRLSGQPAVGDTACGHVLGVCRVRVSPDCTAECDAVRLSEDV